VGVRGEHKFMWPTPKRRQQLLKAGAECLATSSIRTVVHPDFHSHRMSKIKRSNKLWRCQCEHVLVSVWVSVLKYPFIYADFTESLGRNVKGLPETLPCDP